MNSTVSRRNGDFSEFSRTQDSTGALPVTADEKRFGSLSASDPAAESVCVRSDEGSEWAPEALTRLVNLRKIQVFKLQRPSKVSRPSKYIEPRLVNHRFSQLAFGYETDGQSKRGTVIAVHQSPESAFIAGPEPRYQGDVFRVRG